MRDNHLFHFSWILVTCILLAACVPGSLSENPFPTPQELTPKNTTGTLPVPRTTPASLDLFNGCPSEEQALAMRKSQVPDWRQIGIFTCYQLSLNLTDSSRIYPGHETLFFNNQTGIVLNELVLRLYPNAKNIYNGKISIQTVIYEGVGLPFEIFLPDNTGLLIHLINPLEPEETIKIDLAFQIELPLDFDSETSYGIFNQSSEGPELTLANWYPILAVFKDGNWQANPVLMGGDAVTSQTALYKVEIIAPEKWKIASTGTQIQVTDELGLSKHIYVSGPTRDFMIAASPSFEMRQVQVDDISIAQWGPTSTQAGWDDALENARTVLAYYEKTFGSYPFNELDIVAVELQNASGVEYPGLILIIGKSYEAAEQRAFLKLVIAHEIAHQWWYSLVGNDVLIDPWQDEALATYSSMMFLESNSPGNGFLERYKTQVESYEKFNPAQSIEQPLAAFQGRLQEYGLIVYLKGALFFNSIRDQIGDVAFARALNDYYKENKYQLVNPENLLNSFSQSCQCSLVNVENEFGVQPVNP